MVNGDASYFLGFGGGFGGGGFYSPDAKCGGAYTYTEKGWGFSAGGTATVGLFFGDGVSRLNGQGNFFSFAIGPFAMSMSYSGGKLASITAGYAKGSPDVFFVGAAAGSTNTTLHPVNSCGCPSN